jgi:predicted metal-binding membrane protein
MSAPLATLRREFALILAALLGLSALSWGVLIWQATGMGKAEGLTMGMDLALFLAIWTEMMAAMMFPAVAPMVLVFTQVQAGKRRLGQAYVPTGVFTISYLALWVLAGLAAFSGATIADQIGGSTEWFMDNGRRLAGIMLVLAGIYQLTPFKHACLARCRSPLTFVMTSWRDGYIGALRMGFQHGLYCLGCCWLLFVILFPIGMMNVAALLVITLIIFAEKVLPYGDRISWAAAVVLAVYGVVIAIHPAWSLLMPPHHM